MRAMVSGLDTPYPIGSLLPAVLQEDDVMMRLTAALDEVLAPVIATLDCLEAYVDPGLAPADFLEWLAGWVGIDLDENWPLARQRAAVGAAAELHRVRGTVAGLRAHVEAVTGGRVTVQDSGGVAWSTKPGADLPGAAGPTLTVRVAVADPTTVSVAALDALIAATKPVHVTHRLEVVED